MQYVDQFMMILRVVPEVAIYTGIAVIAVIHVYKFVKYELSK